MGNKIFKIVSKKIIEPAIAICILAVLVLSGIWACSSADSYDSVARPSDEIELKYATQFEIKYFDSGYKLIHIADGSDYIMVPEGKEEDDLGVKDAVFIREKPQNIYLAASSAMDLFVRLSAIDKIKTCSTSAADYSIEEAKKAIESGSITYVGKYSSPDYETILDSGCELAIESTMITHTPKIKEELERLGIPVLTERSSYEKDPLGRLEWIKLYGVLLGREDEANSFFEKEEKKVLDISQELKKTQLDEASKKKVSYFYISSNGYVNVRKPGDYVSAMIEMAGGGYAYNDLVDESDNALSTMNINWEEFYKNTVDADILIYNATIDGGVDSIGALLDKNALFADFKAVKEGNVYCSNADMFQKTSCVADMITDLYNIINDGYTDDSVYIYKLED